MYPRAVPNALRFATGTASPWLTEVLTPVVTLSVFLALIIGAAVFLTVTLLRHGNSLTQNADGLLIEQESRVEAHRGRVSFGTFAVRNAPPSMADHYRR